MSLLQQAMTDVVMLDRKTESDGEGGFVNKWEDGAKFRAAITFDTSMQARTAEVQGVTSLYTVTTDHGAVLQYHDVFRRESDGKIFRVTSDGDDKATPPTSTLRIRQVSAEEWRLA